MANNDNNFPLINYHPGKDFFDWGLMHGESFKDAINELFQIRKELMLQKNPKLKNELSQLALKQWEVTKEFSPELSRELTGIANGSGLGIEEIVILNNYTDFRDIQLPEEGCSTVHIQTNNGALSGQTWDMHRSAMDYLCTLHVPANEQHPEAVVLSLVGCVGLMGLTARGTVVGVNNINTQNARAGLIWPILVRQALKGQNRKEMSEILKKAPVTSGHNYILSDLTGGEHWEVTPEVSQCVALSDKSDTWAFHTNHCLGDKIIPLETAGALNSTTQQRYALLEKKVPQVKTYEQLYQLLTDHEGYPKSICSHYESGAQDPSFTCGGAIIELKENKSRLKIWRGCPHQLSPDEHSYIEYSFQSDGEKWHIIKE